MWARGNYLQKISLFASTIDIIQKQRVEFQQAAFLKPDGQSCLLLLLASTFMRKKKKKEVMESNEEINPFCLWKCINTQDLQK